MRGRVMSYYALAYFGMKSSADYWSAAYLSISARETLCFLGNISIGTIILFSKFLYAKPKERTQPKENNN